MKTLPAILIRGGKVVNVGDTLLTEWLSKSGAEGQQLVDGFRR